MSIRIITEMLATYYSNTSYAVYRVIVGGFLLIRGEPPPPGQGGKQARCHPPNLRYEISVPKSHNRKAAGHGQVMDEHPLILEPRPMSSGTDRRFEAPTGTCEYGDRCSDKKAPSA